MKCLTFSWSAMALALVVVVAPVMAAESTHDGKLVSITDGKLVMQSTDGQKHSHPLNANATLTLDGKPCKAADLKPGARIRVTTEGADKVAVSRVEALDKKPDFASNSHDGKLVSISALKLVMTGADGVEHAHPMTADTRMTLDGKACQIADLKPGMRIRVTASNGPSSKATRIEAIDKNLDFASR